MPKIFEPKDLSVAEKGGAKVATLANSAMLRTNALQVERILLQGNAKSLIYEAADAERFAYVVRGQGQAHIGNQKFQLSAESVLWIEKEDTLSLEADADGLEVLLCQAPASE
jgi:quercetin dioxygenase-like cupin family protein